MKISDIKTRKLKIVDRKFVDIFKSVSDYTINRYDGQNTDALE